MSKFTLRRDEIIEVAAALFAEKGYHATSIEDLTTVLKLGRGALYHYISSKEEILFEIHNRFIDPLLTKGRTVKAQGMGPIETLKALSRVLMGVIAEYKNEVTVFLRERHALVDKERWQVIEEKRHQFENMVETTIMEGQQAELFHELPSRLVTFGFLGIHNWAYEWLNPKGVYSPDQIAETFCDIILFGLVIGNETVIQRRS